MQLGLIHVHLWFYCDQLFSCIDINECTSGVHNCAQLCTNTEGSYTCGCRAGYQLNSDRLRCDGEINLMLKRLDARCCEQPCFT